MLGDNHTASQLRQLADELWERGFKQISTHVYNVAAIREWDESIAKRIKDKQDAV